KTAFTSCMAGNTSNLLHQITNGVAVAVQQDLADTLHVAGFFALAPDFATRTRPVNGTALSTGQCQCLTIDPGMGQHAKGFCVLCNHRNQPFLVPLHLIQPLSSIHDASMLFYELKYKKPLTTTAMITSVVSLRRRRRRRFSCWRC